MSGIGYLNARHTYTWDFVDDPLAYQVMLGTQYADDGLQLTWLAPTNHFIELGLEAGRGRSFPGGDNSRNGAGMLALTAHTGATWGRAPVGGRASRSSRPRPKARILRRSMPPAMR